MSHIHYSDNLDDFPEDYDDGIPIMDNDDDEPGQEPGHTVPAIDFDTAAQGLQTSMHQIVSSNAWKEFRQYLGTALSTHQHRIPGQAGAIVNAVMLGGGSFSEDSTMNTASARAKSTLQSAFFLCVVEQLSAFHGGVHAFAGELDYHPQDQQIFASFGVHASNDNLAMEQVHENTFLYMPFLNANVKEDALHQGPGIVFADAISGSGPASQYYMHQVTKQNMGQLLSSFGSAFVNHYLYA